ncbi:DUF2989 domain-containing protein [Agarivorans sp. MS3-6]|uniref:DUF2989 domain-containing protein n=1 Tax=Agarivorans sp. TSD2052 TaxID=2937286 RepID=UPI00200D957D|nr:DUF2989 domain-containing protein [Agarivorans sp. TSD2052]UPW20433.1 DUF2989 domain-containing protein [Agarivorans sp. TSD2052]
MSLFKPFSLSLCLVVPLTLSGCDTRFNFFGFGSPTIKSICKNNPELCDDLNRDGWCKNERSAVIFSRLDERQEPSEPNKYALIRDYSAYNFCIELAASIEPKYDKSRKTQRVIGMLTSLEELQRLEQETKESDYPFLSKYHWTQLRNEQAGKRFLALEGTEALNHPELQWTLAIYYSGKDANKAISILQNIFKLYSTEASIPAKYAEAITSQYMSIKDYPNAYLWARVSAKFSDHSTQDYAGLNHLLKMDEQQKQALDNTADKIFEQIEKRQYQP